MIIAIRKEPEGYIYIDKTFIERFGAEQLEDYGYTAVVIDDKYFDCEGFDFNDDLTFNVKKYNTRKLKEEKQIRIPKIQLRLDELNKDFIQKMLGAVIPNIDEKEAEFVSLHNELRELQGKEPRIYK